MLFENKKSVPHAAVFAGRGASHSWTWFADISDRAGYHAVSFFDEQDVTAGSLAGCDLFFVSGGDTFGIAEGLGAGGAAEIEKFVRGGGTYIGACAGAYLPLNSSLAPLNAFNFVNARIVNLTKNLPAPRQMAEKFCTEYGCRYVFHPVREEIVVRLNHGQETISAPLYGGPALIESDDVEVLAQYAAFTDKTEFLIDQDTARETLIGRVAAARKRHGEGTWYLFGPHFEHPDYRDANDFLFKIIFGSRSREQGKSITALPQTAATRDAYREFLSQVSNARIIALGLERSSYAWLIGKKVYDPEKIRVFLEAVWSRARILESQGGYAYVAAQAIDGLAKDAEAITALLKDLRETEAAENSDLLASKLFTLLRGETARFLSIYFKLKREGLLEHTGRPTCTTVTSISPQPQRCTQRR